MRVNGFRWKKEGNGLDDSHYNKTCRFPVATTTRMHMYKPCVMTRTNNNLYTNITDIGQALVYGTQTQCALLMHAKCAYAQLKQAAW